MFSLVVHNVGNACLFLLLILSIVAMIMRGKPMGMPCSTLFRQYWPLHLAMAAVLAAVLLNEIGLGQFEGRQIDRAFRLALFLPISWIVLCVPLRHLKLVQWSFIVGIITALIQAYIVTNGGRLPNSGSVGFIAGIAFSNAVLLLGVWVLLSIGWNKDERPLVSALKIAAGLAAMAVTVMVKTRGTWLALPFFSLFILMFVGNIRLRNKLAVVLATIVVAAGVFTTSPAVQNRIYDARDDVAAYANASNVDTSIGQRLELWKGSWHIFREHPVFGIGRADFRAELEKLAERGIITPSVVVMPHSHNAIFFHMALWGIFGLAGILLVYCVPFYYFVKDIRHADRQVSTAAAMGATLCLGFFIYDLTDVMFFWVVLNGFYVINMAIFFAIVIKRKDELRTDSRATAQPA
jgi:O-antigen ligase